MYDLVEKYEPDIIWSDGYGGGNSDYWNVTEFLAWYATNSTVAETAVWNDRWGRDTMVRKSEREKWVGFFFVESLASPICFF